MNINITTEAMEIKMELSAEQAQNIINYALEELKGNDSQTEKAGHYELGVEQSKEKAGILPRKPYVFRSESRNEHLFGNSAGARRDFGKEGYKGFLAVKCESCGKVTGFCAKYPLTFHRCSSCGSTTELKALKPMYVKCKCGKEFKYRTNMWERYIDFNCLDCGAPVTLELNNKKGVYNTI
jgi:ribosomal protein S27E